MWKCPSCNTPLVEDLCPVCDSTPYQETQIVQNVPVSKEPDTVIVANPTLESTQLALQPEDELVEETQLATSSPLAEPTLAVNDPLAERTQLSAYDFEEVETQTDATMLDPVRGGLKNVSPGMTKPEVTVIDCRKTCPGCMASLPIQLQECTNCGYPFVDATNVTKPLLRLVLLQGTREKQAWNLTEGVHAIGSSLGNIRLEGVAPLHATLRFRPGQLTVHKERPTCAIFLRINKAQPVANGDGVCFGSQLMRFYSDISKIPPMLLQQMDLLDQQQAAGATTAARRLAGETYEFYFRYQRSFTLGRDACDISIPDDPGIAPHQITVTNRGRGFLIENVAHTGGTFCEVRANHRALVGGDQLLIGKHRLRVDY